MDAGRALEVLILGDLQAAEFSCLLPTLGKFHGVRWHPAEAVDDQAHFDLVLLCASRPGRFTEAGITPIRQRSPLARFVQIHGPWCYGEARTWPLPAAIERMAWYEAAYRLPRLLQSAFHPNMPVTSSPQEQALASVDCVTPSMRGGEIGIYARSAADFGLWESACQALGLSASWADFNALPASPWDAVVAMLPGTDRAEFAAVAQAFRLAGEIPKLLCVGAPTWEDWQKGHSCGATAILGQPFALADVAQLLIPQGDCGILPLVNRAANR